MSNPAKRSKIETEKDGEEKAPAAETDKAVEHENPAEQAEEQGAEEAADADEEEEFDEQDVALNDLEELQAKLREVACVPFYYTAFQLLLKPPCKYLACMLRQALLLDPYHGSVQEHHPAKEHHTFLCKSRNWKYPAGHNKHLNTAVCRSRRRLSTKSC